jgi:starvation-inducible outer membrane lipoprotein
MRLLAIILIVLLAACTTGPVKLSGNYTLQAIAAEKK